MSEIKIPSENLVGAEDNPPLPENPGKAEESNVIPNILSDDIKDYESERRCLFRIAFASTLVIIFALYVGLGCWIFSQSTGYHIHSNMWHIAIILAIPPTTLLFLVLKVLAKQPVEQTSSYPASEFFAQLINILKEWVSKK